MNQSPPLISATMPAFQITVVELFFVRLLTNKEEVNRMKVGELAKCLLLVPTSRARVLFIQFGQQLLLKWEGCRLKQFITDIRLNLPATLLGCWLLQEVEQTEGRWRYPWFCQSKSRSGYFWSCSPCPQPDDLPRGNEFLCALPNGEGGSSKVFTLFFTLYMTTCKPYTSWYQQ